VNLVPRRRAVNSIRGPRPALRAAGCAAVLAGAVLVAGPAGPAQAAAPADIPVPAFLYATSGADDTVAVIGLSTNTVVNAFGHAGFTDMVGSPTDSVLWGTLTPSTPGADGAGNVRGVSTSNFHPTEDYALGTTPATSIGISADGNTVYALSPADSTISAIDQGGDDTVTNYPLTLAPGAVPQDLAVDGSDLIGYVTDSTGTVTAIDLTTGDVEWSLSVGATAGPAVLSNDEDELYVENQAKAGGALRVARINTSRGPEATQWKAAGDTLGPLAISADDSLVFAANPVGGTVDVLDTTTGKSDATVHLGGAQEPTALIADSDTLFIGTSPHQVVVAYSLVEKKIVARIATASDLGGGPSVTEFALGPAVPPYSV
jgi:hypothetical protein